jgi:hypothetical protein
MDSTPLASDQDVGKTQKDNATGENTQEVVQEVNQIDATNKRNENKKRTHLINLTKEFHLNLYYFYSISK